MDFDETMQSCTLTTEEELKKLVAPAKEWLQNLHDLVICFEDEIGLFVGLRSGKVAVPKEVQKQALKRKRLHTKTKEGVEKVQELEKEAGGGLTQTRGMECKGEDKRRITILHRLLLTEFVQGTVNGTAKRNKPRGKLERTVVVLPGRHCNADYMDEDETGAFRWNRNWSYEFQGKQEHYKKGDKVGAMMQQVQAMKRAFPELTNMFLILQQPAAFRDGIIVGWCLEDLNRRHKFVMMQHDLVGCQSTAEVKQLNFLFES